MHRRHLDSLDWDDITKRLLVYVKHRLGNRGSLQDAEDITNAAIMHLFDPDYADWNPDKEPDVMRYLGSLVNGAVASHGRREQLRGSREPELLLALWPEQPRTPEDELQLSQESTRALQHLLERVDGDPVCKEIVLLTHVEGIDEPGEQARRLGLPIDDIYKARRRRRAHYAAVRKHLERETNHDQEAYEPNRTNRRAQPN